MPGICVNNNFYPIYKLIEKKKPEYKYEYIWVENGLIENKMSAQIE
jgi:hypothetical protein